MAKIEEAFHRLQEDNRKIEEALLLQEEINRCLKLEILENKEKTQRIMAQDFNNLVVQLVYVLVHAKILSVIPESPMLFRDKHAFKFNDVFSCENVGQRRKDKFKLDPTYVTLKGIMNQRFWNIVRFRNVETHPVQLCKYCSDNERDLRI